MQHIMRTRSWSQKLVVNQIDFVIELGGIRMAKADAIEVEGAVIRKVTKRNVSGRIGKWT